MENNMYSMPGRQARARPQAHAPALWAHYGDENGEMPLEDAVQSLTPAARAHVEKMYRLYDEFEGRLAAYHEQLRTNRRIYELDDPGLGKNEPQLPVLLSTILNKIADQLDNMPEAVLSPESPQMQEFAEDATDVVRWIFEHNDYDTLYAALSEDFYVTGTAITQIHWDEDMDSGDGNVKLMRVPPETMTWDPAAKDLQSCRAIFKTAFHPRGWYVEHYPNTGIYVQPDSYTDRGTSDSSSGDEQVMLLEAWWREYDAAEKRYKINVSHMAGHVLLYDSRDTFPEGIYAHGEYPFALAVYRHRHGNIGGMSCIEDYVEMNRYACRNAKYIDLATRLAARPKLLLGQGMEIRNRDALTNADAQIIDVIGRVGPDTIAWMPQPSVPQLAYQMQNWYMETLKQESGQNQFARGEGGMGITAASAIQSLQEAGAKTSRMECQRMSSMYRETVGQILWLIAQFFDPPRIVMITGRRSSPYEAQEVGIGRDQITDRLDLHPAYKVNTQLRRRNPLRIESENQMVLKLYEMSLNSGDPLPLRLVIELLQIDGKDRIMDKINDEMNMRTQRAETAAEEAAQSADAANAQLNDVRRKMINDARAAMPPEMRAEQ